MILAVDKLLKFQKKKKLTLTQVASELDITNAYLSLIYSGKRKNLSDDLKLKIQEVTKNYVRFSDWGKRI